MLLANYMQSAWRNILRHKLFSIINILGLAMGLAAVMLIALYVRYETGYDSFWKNADNIYRVHMEWNFPGEDPDHDVVISGPIIKAMQRHYPEIEYSTRIRNIQRPIEINNELFQEDIAVVDPDILDIFDFNIISGDAISALNDEASIVLNKTLAFKYFGEADPLGQIITITLDKLTRDYKVAAISEDLPVNSKLNVKAMIKINDADWSDTFMESWYITGTHSYFKVDPNADIGNINDSLETFVDRYFPPASNGIAIAEIITLTTMNMKNLHLDAKGNGEWTGHGDRDTIIMFSVVAVLILLIASINFMNLSVARSTQRAKEVSMRKVVGANRKHLFIQFVSESVLMTLLGLFLSLCMVEASLPFFIDWTGNSLKLNYASVDSLFILLLTLTIGVAGGAYPAFILSSYHPAKNLRSNKSTEDKNSITFRTILVVIQFSISIALFVSTAVIYGQVKFARDIDLGYNKSNLLTIHGNNFKKLNEKGILLIDRVNRLDGVSDITWSGNFYPGSRGTNITSVRVENSENTIPVGSRFIGYDFLKTYQIPLISGRGYSRDRNDKRPTIEEIENGTANAGALILNVAALNHLGLGSPQEAIGKTIYRDRSDDPSQKLEAEFQIIGVIDDVKFRDLKTTTSPEIYRLNTDTIHYISMRISGNRNQLVEEIKQIWNQEIPEIAFYYDFAEETLINQYVQEQNQMTMFAAFSGLAIFIACLGLFGLASFTAERRTKEIGIRKVFGAEVWQIVKLLVWQFSKPVLIANVIAWPIAYLTMSRWLESFVYRIDDMVIIALCLVAGLTALLIAWATIAGNSYAVARQSPINALRYE